MKKNGNLTQYITLFTLPVKNQAAGKPSGKEMEKDFS
jgi:hypothetical protein